MTGDIVITEDPSKCPRCGSTRVSRCGGDMDGQGNYFFMYLCEDCGRKEVPSPEGTVRAVQVFLVPCTEEEYEEYCHAPSYAYDPYTEPPSYADSNQRLRAASSFREGDTAWLDIDGNLRSSPDMASRNPVSVRAAEDLEEGDMVRIDEKGAHRSNPKLQPRVTVCPKCGSEDIGQLDEGLPAETWEYEQEGGRYYCLSCGWTEPKYWGYKGLQSWPYAWPDAICSRCGAVISDDTPAGEVNGNSYFNRYGWINPENPDEVLCWDCYEKRKDRPWWKFW